MNKPDYTDEKFWNDIIKQYTENSNKFSGVIDIERDFWNYFKYCLKKGNRYFFEHPLLPLLRKVFAEHIYILEKGTSIYRARIDEEYKLRDDWYKYSDIEIVPKYIKRIENRGTDKSLVKKLKKDYDTFVNSDETRQIRARIEAGYQGFDAENSSAPPSSKANEGRCNPKGVSYLYAALEKHTAVAEIRPYINDSISIALLNPVHDLKLVNLDYEPGETIEGKDFLFNEIQTEFSAINKGKSHDYLTTQYITSLIESLGYDGLSFRSSLVRDGTNYVIFSPLECEVKSSELNLLYEVKYNFSKYK